MKRGRKQKVQVRRFFFFIFFQGKAKIEKQKAGSKTGK